MMINTINRTLILLIGLWEIALMLRVLLPWFKIQHGHPVMHFLVLITDPLVRPVRRFMGASSIIWIRGGYIDMASLVTLFLLTLVQSLVSRLLYWIAVPPLWILQPGADWGRWLVGVLGLLVQLYNFALLARILLAWVRVPYTQPVMRFLWNVTEPLLRPIRRRLPNFAGLDFSPIVAVLLLSVAQMLLAGLIQAIF
ncbi:MAG: YggT family protein [Chloroflexota bacterium]|nr:YggT family protein [Chloroflexota bacterium]